jgi:hypothetical protein
LAAIVLAQASTDWEEAGSDASASAAVPIRTPGASEAAPVAAAAPRKPRRFGWKVLSLWSLVIGAAVHFSSRHNRMIIHVRGLPLCGGSAGRLVRSSICVTRVWGRGGPSRSADLRKRATVVASSEAATAWPTILGNSWSSFAAHARHGDPSQRLQSLWRQPRVLGRPSRPKDRTPPTKLEITFGHAFDRREVSSSKSAVRACVLSVFDQPSRSAPYSRCQAA